MPETEPNDSAPRKKAPSDPTIQHKTVEAQTGPRSAVRSGAPPTFQPTREQVEANLSQWFPSDIDNVMCEVYKHLQDAFADKSYEGQELKLGRAFRAITQFEMDHMSTLTTTQMASLAFTRDQVARFQVNLYEAGEPLGLPMELLEGLLRRMKLWRHSAQEQNQAPTSRLRSVAPVWSLSAFRDRAEIGSLDRAEIGIRRNQGV